MNALVIGPASFLWIAIAALIAGFCWKLGEWVANRVTAKRT